MADTPPLVRSPFAGGLTGWNRVGSTQSVARYGRFALNTGEEMTVNRDRDDQLTAR
jgi:hypothetical protein